MAVNRRTIRIFISSTFSDFRAERDALHDRVFPDLRQLCAQHGARFRAIDLRWGVNESASLDQHTMRICLEEIARCQRLSPKPNFLVLLGDRYGWQQLPDAIPADEFKAVQAQVASTDGATGVTLLDRWYRCDDNAVPPEYILQPRTGEAASNYAVWEAEERELRKILRNAVEKLELPEVRRAKYLLSATGQEILHGALDPMLTDAKEHVFGFFRSIDELPNGHSAVDARDYLDLVDGQPDKGAHTRLDDLKARLRARLPANITEYKARWTESRITTDHLDAFCEDVRTQLTQVIEVQLANNEEIAPLAQEIADHTAFAKELADSFTGRNQALRELSEYLTTVAAEQSPTVVHAPSGAGKSAFMAEVARQARLAHPTAVIVQRFIGATPSSSNPITLLRQILAQITEAYGDSAVSVPTERKELLESIPSLLGQATPEQPLLIVLDALDQLQVSWDFTLADWLPTELPAHVHLVVSTTQSDTLQELKHCAPNAHYHALADLSLEDGKQILDTWLASVDRCLTDGQKQQVLDGFAHIGQLLYLQLAFERARHWRSYDAPKNLAGDVRGLVRMLIAELSLENNHGKLLVDRVLDCLAAARHGLTEDELLDVLSRDEEVLNDFRRRAHKAPVTNELPVVVWSRLYGDLSPYLVERDANGAKVLAFFNKQFMELAVEESLQAEKIPLRAAALADYFASQPNFLDAECNRPNARKLAELPYHLIRAERWQQLEDTLMHFDFCMAKCQLNESDDLVGYFRDALQAIPDSSDEFRLWESFMSERMHILRRGDERWPAHKILLQLAIEHADDSPVTKAAEIWLENGNCNWVWMRNNLRIKHASASPCIGILEGHACSFDIQGAIEHSNGNIISWNWTDVILWDRNGNEN